VRYLQQRIAAGGDALGGWNGRRIGVVTGTAMAQLMPQVLEPLEQLTGASFELIPVVNSLFGARVTTAGLLPGAAVHQALRDRESLSLVLLPGESLNDEGLFIDGMSLQLLQASLPVELRASKDFADALVEPVAL